MILVLHYNSDLVILSSFFCLIFIILYSTPIELNKNNFALDRLFSSWKDLPIKNIKQIVDNKDLNCKDYNNSFNIIDYRWAYNNETNLHCINKENNCLEVESKIIHANYWKKVSLCGEFDDKYQNYFSIVKTEYNSTCPQQYPHNCGIFDTLNNSLCVTSKLECPLNYLSLVSRYNDFILKPEYTNNYKYNDEKIYTSFKVLDSQPCFNKEELENNESLMYSGNKTNIITNTITNGNTSQSIITYSLNKCISHVISNNNTIYYDNRYNILDSYSKRDFYEYNNILNELFYLPNYPNIKDKSIQFYAGVYVGWNKVCEFENILDVYESYNIFIQIYNDYQNYFLNLTVLGLVIFIGVLLIDKYYVCMNSNINKGINSNYFNCDEGNEDVVVFDDGYFSNFNIESFQIFRLTFYYLIIACIASSIISLSKSLIDLLIKTNIKRFFELVNENNCSDDVTNSSLEIVAKTLLTHYQKINFIITFSYIILAATAFVCFNIYIFKFKYKSY